MNSIFLDLEMNPVSTDYPEVRAVCRQEIIEIGAAKYDEQETLLSTFREYVKPACNEDIMPTISRLTGITNETVADAKPFTEVMDRFLTWCGEDAHLFCWSKSDTAQLRKESIIKTTPLDGTFKNAKSSADTAATDSDAKKNTTPAATDPDAEKNTTPAAIDPDTEKNTTPAATDPAAGKNAASSVTDPAAEDDSDTPSGAWADPRYLAAFDGRLAALLDGWTDVQQEFVARSGITRIMGLDKAMELCGVEFNGHAHDALSDAQATAELHFELLHGEDILAIHDIMTSDEEPLTTSLGSLFSGLNLPK